MWIPACSPPSVFPPSTEGKKRSQEVLLSLTPLFSELEIYSINDLLSFRISTPTKRRVGAGNPSTRPEKSAALSEDRGGNKEEIFLPWFILHLEREFLLLHTTLLNSTHIQTATPAAHGRLVRRRLVTTVAGGARTHGSEASPPTT